MPGVSALLAAGRPVTVGFLGGSVTAGAGASDPEKTSWRALVSRHLQSKFPDSAFRFVNGAIGGTDSVYGAFRFGSHIMDVAVPDLLFAEFSVNDDGDRTRSIRGMEGIVRHARTINPDMSVCFLYSARHGETDGFRKGETRPNIVHHEEVAAHYGLPSLNFAAEFNRLLADGVWTWDRFSEDDVHPTDDGYRIYADSICAFLDGLLGSGSSTKPAGPGTLPAPLDAFNYGPGRLLSPDVLEDPTGWKYEAAWSAEKVCNWNPPAAVLSAEWPGSRFSLAFEGRAVGLALLAGMDAGAIDYRIDGLEWQRAELFDDYCKMFHRPKIALLADGLIPGIHRLEVRVSERSHGDSMGYAVRIQSILLNG